MAVTKYITLDSLGFFYEMLRSDKYAATQKTYGAIKLGGDSVPTNQRGLQIDGSGNTYVELFPGNTNNNDIGSDIKPIYIDKGGFVESKANVGSGAAADTSAQAIYMKGGSLTAITKDIGSATKPIYMKGGVFTASAQNLGSGDAAGTSAQAIYMKGGSLTAITKTIGSATKPIYMNNGVFTACNDIVYTTEIVDENGNPQNNLAAVSNFGGLPSNTKMSDLNTKTFSQIFDMLLFPDDNNITIQNSGISSFSITTSSSAYAGTAVTTVNNTGTFSQGTWNKYNGSNAALGVATDWQYSLTGPTGFTAITGDKKTTAALAKTSFNGKITSTVKYTKPGTYTFTAKVWYAASSYVPKNNKGVLLNGQNGYPDKRPAASSTTSTQTVKISLPWYATTSSISTLTEQSWREWKLNSETQFTVVFQDANQPTETKQRFLLPAQTSSLKVLDTSTGQWKDDSHNWSVTTTSKTINGLSFTYYLYVNKASESSGAQTLKIKF